MTLFWIISAAMVIVALVLFAPALLRPTLKNETTGDSQNAEIARERLDQLQLQHANGDLSETEFAEARNEVERILAEELAHQDRTRFASGNPFGKATLVLVIILLPIFTVGFYQLIGSPKAITGLQQLQSQEMADASLPDLVEHLAERLRQEPDNVAGWFLLGRSQMAMGRYADAVTAFRHVDALSPDTPAVLLALANAIAMTQEASVLGEPETLVLRSLAIEPNEPIALWLAGNAREEAGAYEEAIALWSRAVPLLAENPDEQQELINRIRILAAIEEIPLPADFASQSAPAAQVAPVTEQPAAIGVTVTVALDDAVAGQVKATDSVFVFARALEGPPMPLAAARYRVADLPVTVTLDDSMAMMPTMKLSDHALVRVSAKVSLSDNAMPADDDFISDEVVLDLSAAAGSAPTLNLLIDRARITN